MDQRRGLLPWLFLIGFGLAAQFDSVVLHRLLGWHHLVSQARPDATEAAHRAMDARFDLVMTGLLLAGIAGLFVNRRALPGLAPRRGVAWGLAGFGAWHLADAVIVHALLRLHRIHPGSDHPLFWDVLWPVLFGLGPVGLALGLLRRGNADAGKGRGAGPVRGTRRSAAPPGPDQGKPDPEGMEQKGKMP